MRDTTSESETTNDGVTTRGQNGDRESDATGLRAQGPAAVARSLQQVAGNQALKELHERGQVQAKLEVSQPGDPAEREAERVAREVVDSPDSTAAAESDVEIRRRASGAGQTAVDGRREARIDALRSGGSPLSRSVRSDFESRFGRDFSDVRVHAGPEADAVARSIDARAFTIGRDVAFANGNYRPETRRGKRLLAHELTHVVQQTGARARTVQREEDDTLPDKAAVFGLFVGLHIEKTKLVLAYGKMEEVGLSSRQIRRAFLAMYDLAEADAGVAEQVISEIGDSGVFFKKVMGNIDAVGNLLGAILTCVKVLEYWQKGRYGAAFGEVYKTAMGGVFGWAGLLDALQSLVGLFLPDGTDSWLGAFFDVLQTVNPLDLGRIGVDAMVTVSYALFEALYYGKSAYGRVNALVERMEDSAAGAFVDLGQRLGLAIYEIVENPEKVLPPATRRVLTGDTRSNARKDTDELLETIRNAR